jgi:ribulose 1,5-bisphosphate synthetase/thiazole synthase
MLTQEAHVKLGGGMGGGGEHFHEMSFSNDLSRVMLNKINKLIK